MNSGASLSSMDLTANTGRMSRRHPLHTCGVSFLAIAHKTYTKAQEFNGPKGSIAKKIATLASLVSPIVYAIQYQWLAILSFVDDHILAIETMIENFFPISSHLFNKIDELVLIIETLPSNFDLGMNEVPIFINKIPFLDRIVGHAISWLKFFISILTYWGSNNTREKEITIDINSQVESPTNVECESVQKSSSASDFSEDETKTMGKEDPPVESPSNALREISDAIKCSYKEILEKGRKENVEKKVISEANDEKKENVEGIGSEDPILELFESSNPVESPTKVESESVEKSSSASDFSEDETKTMEKEDPPVESPSNALCESSDAIKCSYKEILDKGMKENVEKKVISEAIDEKKENVEGIGSEDPSLELFESSNPVESPTNVECDSVQKSFSASDFSEDETKTMEKEDPPVESPSNALHKRSDARKCSYKEILEKGTTKESVEKVNVEEIGSEESEDSILELFEAGWHMKPGKGVKRSSLSR